VKNELIDAIKLGDERKIDESFNKLITAIFDEGRSYREYQLLLSNLIIDLMTEFQGAGETIDQLYQDRGSIFDDLSELTTKQEIIAWLKQTIIDPVADMLNKRRDIHYSDISEQIKRTIHEHYDSDITLEFLSSRINYHPNYIKRVFRQETGVNFSEYLSEYRLKIAKKWLLETDMKISEIADRLRYNNSQNFIRYFRKAEGITPGEFRKQGK
jgi:YesN/AraC family two-component response regulator